MQTVQWGLEEVGLHPDSAEVKGDSAKAVTFQQLYKSPVSWVETNDQHTQCRGSRKSRKEEPPKRTLCCENRVTG